MNRIFITSTFILFNLLLSRAQEAIPLDTIHWDIAARSYVLETYKGQESIYLQAGTITLKEAGFLNGTIEYDVYLTGERGFPGVNFRINGNDAEKFYVRPHQSGNPDANQAVPVTKGITPWQLYFGPRYSFPYVYSNDRWTHVKIVVNNNRAQVFLDHSEKPHLSWQLFHEPRAGGISISGGLNTGMHIANIKIDPDSYDIKDFKPGEREALEGLIGEWEISDKFPEELLNDTDGFSTLISSRQWENKISVEEGTAANISRAISLRDDKEGNTVFARITIDSKQGLLRLFEFGYSDRVVVFLNGSPVYRGNNQFQSRDYRYLGTIGLFDAVYLDLKKGKNTLLLAVSENFGGWLVTGRFQDREGLTIK